MKKSQSKGAIFSLDGILASLAVVLIAYIGFIVFSTIAERTLLMAENQEMESKLLLASDYLVKYGLSESDDSRVYPHKVDVEKLRELDTKKLAEQLGVEKLKASLAFSLGGEDVLSRGEGVNCVQRIVWVSQHERVGYLETCID
ncbi:MAG: hypothetical protein ABIF01_03055 [Candidatus Micrarchaeota archaeon]